MMARRFPPPWSIDDPDPKLERQCFIYFHRFVPAITANDAGNAKCVYVTRGAFQ
jgi:hypothetical protein